jgi:hypothetical protein
VIFCGKRIFLGGRGRFEKYVCCRENFLSFFSKKKDMTDQRIPVYIIRDQHYEDRSNLVASLFIPQTFLTIVPDIPLGSPKSDKNYYNRAEAHQVGWCLRNAQKRFPNQPVIIIKDSSICVADPQTISDIITSTISLSVGEETFHLCYLCRWMDKCQLYSNRKSIPGTTTGVVRTQSPHDIQALLFTPQGRDTILGKIPMNNGKLFQARDSLSETFNREIVAGNLTALCIVPNLMEYDIRLASRDCDYLKSNACAPIPVLHQQSSSVNIYVAFIIVVILLIVLVWAAAYVAP